jgi:NAD(P)-dependent dehydrogenase (short-subunit alcohol dehydrogenase family)
MSLDGHIVLITCAGQGIGKACTFAFAEKGADPIVWDKTSRPLERLFVN